MNLNVLISTIDERIEQAGKVLLEKRDDVQYIISHQYTDNKFIHMPEELIRQDVIISRIPGKGVARSRNNVIKLATAQIALFSDDDVKYTHANFDRIIKTFSDDPSLDVAIFKIKTPEGEPEYKSYPPDAMRLKRLPFSVGTVEIACRIEKIRKCGIWFDERFGAGRPLLIGSEESIFILDCIKAGLNVWYYPVYIVEHPYDSLSRSLPQYDKRKVSVAGAFDSRINGWLSIPKAFFNTLKYLPDLIRHRKNPLIYLKERLWASFYILFTKPDQSN